MPSAIIIYGSTTGSTELMAGYIGEGIEDAGIDVTIKNVLNASIDDLHAHDLIFLGCSTWGDGDMQDDFMTFYDAMEGVDLSGKKGAAFGPGDSSYDMFCEAVNMLEHRMRKCGVTIIAPGLKIDGDVVDAEDDIIDWARQAAIALT
ncbi:MAG: flavodoxin [Armatimonadota bacterium]|jgi:flavodoxin I